MSRHTKLAALQKNVGVLDDPHANAIRAMGRIAAEQADERHRESPVIDVTDLNIREVPPRCYLMDPIIPERLVVEIVGHRGVGKTWFLLSLAHAMATGSAFLRWTAPMARRVLYLDGEMDLAELKDRTVAIALAMGNPMFGAFRIWTPDIAGRMPDLSTKEGQAMIEPYLTGTEVVIVDAISTLCRTGIENDAESWGPVQDWALDLKRRGVSIAFAHHTGWQKLHGRGTSKREDIMNTVILLKEADNHGDGTTRFEVHLTKRRGISGPAALPIKATFSIRDGKAEWTWAELRDAKARLILELHEQGMKQRAIAKKLEISLGSVNLAIKKAALQ